MPGISGLREMPDGVSDDGGLGIPALPSGVELGAPAQPGETRTLPGILGDIWTRDSLSGDKWTFWAPGMSERRPITLLAEECRPETWRLAKYRPATARLSASRPATARGRISPGDAASSRALPEKRRH